MTYCTHKEVCEVDLPRINTVGKK